MHHFHLGAKLINTQVATPPAFSATPIIVRKRID